MAQKLSSLPIRAKVKFGTFHGVPIVWIVGDKNHSGYPNNSVTLVSNQILKLMSFDAMEPNTSVVERQNYGNNRYIYSNIRQWMNSAAAAGEWYTPQYGGDSPPNGSYTYFGRNPYDGIAGFLHGFTADERSALLDTTLTVGKSDGGGTETCVDKMFLLSSTEVSQVGSTTNGSVIGIFNSDASRIATITAECVTNSNYDGTPTANSAWLYWLRDPNISTYSATNLINNQGLLSSSNAFLSHVGMRPACNLSGDVMVSDTVDASGDYVVTFNQAPTAPSSITVPTDIIGGSIVEISWGSSTDPDGNLSGYILEQKTDSGTWAQIYKGSARSYSAPVIQGSTTVQYRVKAYDTVGAESAYTTSATKTVINNRAPVISGTDANLGTFSNAAPGVEYIVTDADGDQVTVVEKLDGVVLKQYTAALDATNTLTISGDVWRRILNGAHTATITATDAKGASSTRTLAFTKAVPAIQFEQALAMAADEMPIKALVNIQGSFPEGSILTVWICNNGNDAEPTWEDITQEALTGSKHFFTNTTKTASAWGVKLKVELQRGTATGPCYIQSIGGNFG